MGELYQLLLASLLALSNFTRIRLTNGRATVDQLLLASLLVPSNLADQCMEELDRLLLALLLVPSKSNLTDQLRLDSLLVPSYLADQLESFTNCCLPPSWP